MIKNKHEKKIDAIIAYCQELVELGYIEQFECPTRELLKQFNAAEIAEYAKIFSDKSL